jgi:ribose transport system permease protein
VVWVAILDLALLITFGVLSPGHYFWGVTNLEGLARDAALITLLASGSAYLLGAGQFDISLGANVILSSVVAGKVIIALSGGENAAQLGQYPTLGPAVVVAVVAALATGALIGALNGFVVVRLKVNALIATLGMLGVASGTALILTNGADVPYLPRALQTGFGAASIAGIPDEAIVSGVIALGLWFVLAKNRFGLRTIAIGSSSEAMRRAGVKVDAHTWILFTMAGSLAGLAGLLDLSRFAATNVAGHQTDALAALSAAVIGGATLSGGLASIAGAVSGGILTVVIQSGLLSVGIPAFYQLIAIGAVLIVAVVADQRRRGRA